MMHLMSHRRILIFRHIASMLVLCVLDAHRASRRLLSRTFLRVALCVIGIGLLVMVFAGLVALRQVTRNVESLVGDSMIGGETSVAMRAVVRETQLDLLRFQLAKDRLLSGDEVRAFEERMVELLKKYRVGAYEGDDRANAERIELCLAAYLQALRPFIEQHRPEMNAVEAADKAAMELVDAVEFAYQFNRERIHLSAEEASNAAARALEFSNWLWWSFAFGGLTVVFLYAAYRWLALPEGDDG